MIAIGASEFFIIEESKIIIGANMIQNPPVIKNIQTIRIGLNKSPSARIVPRTKRIVVSIQAWIIIPNILLKYNSDRRTGKENNVSISPLLYSILKLLPDLMPVVKAVRVNIPGSKNAI